MLVHRLHDGVRSQTLPALIRPVPARLAAIRAAHLSRRRHSLSSEIDRQIAQAPIRSDQIFQMRRSGARQTDDEDRSVDRHLLDLRIALQEVVVLQAVRGRLNAMLDELHFGRSPDILVGRYFREKSAESIFEVSRTEILEMRPGLCRLEHPDNGHIERQRVAGLELPPPLRGERRISESVDAKELGLRGLRAAHVTRPPERFALPAFAIQPPSILMRSPV